jgi:hypothetical protein
VAAQFQRPEVKPVAAVKKPRAYRGEPAAVQPKMLTNLPWYDG